MPGTINGIGTAYFGEGHAHYEEGKCTQCGYEGRLKSYDTERYFVVLFIPLFPLGKVHLYNECPSCSSHHRISLKKLQQRFLEDETNLRIELEKGVVEPDAICELLKQFYGHQDPEPFKAIVYDVIGKCKNSAKVLLEVGMLFSYYREQEEAAGCIAKAVTLQETEENKEIFAEVLIYGNNPSLAEKQIVHLLEREQRDSYWLLLLLMESYLTEGMFSEARALYEKVSTVYSDEVYEESLADYNRKIDQLEAKGRNMFSPRIAEKSDPFHDNFPIKSKASLVLPIVLIGLLVGYLLISMGMSKEHTVYIVNGLPQKYSITLDGRDIDLHPYGMTHVVLNEGEYTLSTNELDKARSSQSFKVKTNPFTRLFKRPTFVLNPDHCAFVYNEKIGYGSKGDKGDFRVHTLKLLHTFYNMDYKFIAAPDSIYITSSGKIKKRVSYIDNLGTSTPLLPAFEYLSQDSALIYIDKYVVVNPLDEYGLQYYCSMHEEKSLKFLEERCKKRPVEIEVHRQYQHLVQYYDPSFDLKTHYEKLVKEDSTNSSLMYLLGRIRNDDSARYFFKKAVASPTPTVYAFNALAYDYSSSGDFKSALKYSKEAMNIDSKKFLMQELYINLSIAQKKWDDVYSFAQEQLNTNPGNFYYAYLLHELYQRENKSKDAENIKQVFLKRIQEDPSADLELYKKEFALSEAICTGKKENAFSVMGNVPHYNFYKQLLGKELVEAQKIINTNPQSTMEDFCLLYCYAQKEKNSTIANEALAVVKNKAQSAGKVYDPLLVALEQNSKKDWALIDGNFETKAIYYKMFSYLYPEEKELKQYVNRYNVRKSITNFMLEEL